MANSTDQHDTLALTRPGFAEPATPNGYTTPPAYNSVLPSAAAWGYVPPFATTASAPVIRSNNAAVVGATLGSVSLFLSVIPLFGLVAWVLAPIGLITSGVGLAVGVSRRAGRAGAVYGLISSGVALLICCAWLLLLLAV